MTIINFINFKLVRFIVVMTVFVNFMLCFCVRLLGSGKLPQNFHNCSFQSKNFLDTFYSDRGMFCLVHKHKFR